MEVKATKDEKEVSVEYDFGSNLDEATERFGSETVFSKFVSASKVELQAGLRRCIESGASAEDFASNWKPGVRTSLGKIDIVAATKARFAAMTPEEKEAFLEELTS